MPTTNPTPSSNGERPMESGTTWCILHGGPADGLDLPTADHCCTRRIVIYRTERGPCPDFARPAVYLRNETDQGTYEHRGADGVVRTFPTLGYRFERCVWPEVARSFERQRRAEIDGERAEGGSL